MTKIIQTILYLFFVSVFFACSDSQVLDEGYDKEKEYSPDFRNFYAPWQGTNADNLAFAKQMGYDYIAYSGNMEKRDEARDIRFYIINPEYNAYTRRIDLNTTYSEADKDFISRFAALKDASLSFPDNLATGWFFSATNYSVEPDFQQQAVIDYVVDSILEYVAAREKAEKGFLFGGFMWDVPQLTGDFWNAPQSTDNGVQVTLAYWNGEDRGDKHPDVTHEYATYSDGRAAFYKQLWARMREKYPDARIVIEPFLLYQNYLQQTEQRVDARQLMPDLLVQEKNGTEFITDERIYASGLDYTMVGTTTPNAPTAVDNRNLAGTAASKGALFTWFGRFGKSESGETNTSITQVTPYVQLTRVITSWENLHQTPLEKRSWNGITYNSPVAYMSEDAIYAIQPRTKKLFVVFLKPTIITIPDAYKLATPYRTNELFQEEDMETSDILFNGNTIELKNVANINKGYILK